MSSGRRLRAVSLGIAVLCVLAYLPGLNSPFVQYDDNLYVTNNLPQLVTPGWQGLAKQWNADRAWKGEFVEFFPLRDSVYWALFQGFGLNPLAFHLTSLAFHIAATLLLLFLLLRLGLAERAAGFAALLFALHPVHIESVVWVAGLKDPMYLTFMLVGLLAFARYREKPNVGWYVLMLAGLVLSLLVKSVAIVMPMLMVAMELLVGPRAPWKRIVARVAGPTLIAIEFFATFLFIGKANRVLVPLHGGSFMSHVVLMFWAQARYFKQALLPTSFRLIYCFDPPTGWADGRLWAGVAVVLGAAVLAWAWRKEKLRLFFMAWYALALLPVSNVVPFPAIMADRYLYAATVGTCALLGLLAARLQTRLFWMVTIAVALVLTTTTALRSWVWQDEEALWEEPDLDPACLVDTAYPPAQSHFLRFRSAKDRVVGLLALERALASPGFKDIGEAQVCSGFIAAAGEAWAVHEKARAITWAKTANRLCPSNERGWNITMVINMHDNPPVAAMAATKAWRLNKSPQSEVLMWLARLELNDGKAPAEILRLARLLDPPTCQKIVLWSLDAPAFAPRFSEAVEICLAANTGARPLAPQDYKDRDPLH